MNYWVLQPSKRVLRIEKSSNPWKLAFFRLNRWSLGFSDMVCVIRVWPYPIHAWHIFSLTHTCMAQGKSYNLAGAIHVRLWPALGIIGWLVSYAYGPSHTHKIRAWLFPSPWWYVDVSWWHWVAIRVWPGDTQLILFFSCSCIFVWILLWSISSWFLRPVNIWNTTSSA